MNSIILCEGYTDYTLLQYFMREAYGWVDDSNNQEGCLIVNGKKSRNFYKDNKVLSIVSVGGCSCFKDGLEKVLHRNYLTSVDGRESYSKIVIVTDNDDPSTESNLIRNVEEMLQSKNIKVFGSIRNNQWCHCSMVSQIGITINFSILLLVIPFDENGAMETFLLKAVQESDEYDNKIIKHISCFIDHIDPQGKYLLSRRNKVKAKFDTYFSVRTPVEQFVERQNILKNVSWVDYVYIQDCFKNMQDI